MRFIPGKNERSSTATKNMKIGHILSGSIGLTYSTFYILKNIRPVTVVIQAS
jgi:hypothetical protein